MSSITEKPINPNFLKSPIGTSGRTPNSIELLFKAAKFERINNEIFGTYKEPSLPGNSFHISTMPDYQSLEKTGKLGKFWSIGISLGFSYQVSDQTVYNSLFHMRYIGRLDDKNNRKIPHMLYIDFFGKNQEIFVDMEDKVIGIGPKKTDEKSGVDIKKYQQTISFSDAEKIVQPDKEISSILSNIQIDPENGVFAFNSLYGKSQKSFVLPLQINTDLNPTISVPDVQNTEPKNNEKKPLPSLPTNARVYEIPIDNKEPIKIEVTYHSQYKRYGVEKLKFTFRQLYPLLIIKYQTQIEHKSIRGLENEINKILTDSGITTQFADQPNDDYLAALINSNYELISKYKNGPVDINQAIYELFNNLGLLELPFLIAIDDLEKTKIEFQKDYGEAVKVGDGTAVGSA